MSFFSPPKYDANGVAGTQFNYNQSAATDQQRMNMVNQQTPYGSLNYTSDPNSPGGYSANVALSQPQQDILNQQQGSKLNTGAAAQSLTSNFGSLYGSPPNIDPSSLTNKMMGWGQQYMQPIFDQQQSIRCQAAEPKVLLTVARRLMTMRKTCNRAMLIMPIKICS